MIDQAMKQADEKMGKAVEVTREEFSGVRTGRASPALLQRIVVDYYGTQTPLQQIASISVPEPKTLVRHRPLRQGTGLPGFESFPSEGIISPRCEI